MRPPRGSGAPVKGSRGWARSPPPAIRPSLMWAASILGEPVISAERAPKRRVAILISGRGSNMTALIAAAQAPDYPAEIALVLSNRPDAQGIAAARAAGIATAIVDHTRFGVDRRASCAPPDRERQARRVDGGR